MEEIVLRFSLTTGDVVVEARGFHGSSCQDATRFLRETLGDCTDFKRKAEWYENNIEITGCLNSNLCG